MTLYKINKNRQIWEYASSASSGWLPISDPGTRTLSLAGGLVLYRLDTDRSIWGYFWDHLATPPTYWSQVDNNPNTRAIAGINGGFYQLHEDGSIFQLPQVPYGPWQLLDSNLATRAIVAGPSPTPNTDGGQLYKLHGDGSIWQFMGLIVSKPPPEIEEFYVHPKWQQLDDNPTTIAVVCNYSALYQLRSDGSILQYTGTPMSWQPLYPPSPNVRSIAAGADSLYYLDGDGMVAGYTGTPGSWREVGTPNPATIAIAVDYGFPSEGLPPQLYRLGGDGTIWIYPPAHRVETPDASLWYPGIGRDWVMLPGDPDAVSIWTVSPGGLFD